jgi:hypothetical protein
MSVLPAQVPIHNTKIDADDHAWLIAVVNIVEAQDGDNLLLKLVLETNINEEIPASRELSLMAPSALIFEPETCKEVVDRIRNWVETTDGDGFLDLRN